MIKLTSKLQSDNVMNLRALPSTKFAKYIKQINKNAMNKYLDFLLTGNGLDKINALFSIQDTENKDILHKSFPVILLNLYNEDISIYDIMNMPLLEENIEFKKDYIRNYIRFVYTSRNDIQAYKDLDNIKSELSSIYNEVLTSEERRFLTALHVSNINDSVKPFYNYFIRINDNEAGCEKDIKVLSAILNYKSFNTVPEFVPDSVKDTFASGEACKSLLSVFQKIMCRTINYNTNK